MENVAPRMKCLSDYESEIRNDAERWWRREMFFDVIFSDDAENDLDDICEYIAQNDSTESADYVGERIENIANSLSQFPNRGVCLREFPLKGINKYREVFFKPYRVIYKVDEERMEVNIFVIADGRRDMKELLSRRLSPKPADI